MILIERGMLEVTIAGNARTIGPGSVAMSCCARSCGIAANRALTQMNVQLQAWD